MSGGDYILLRWLNDTFLQQKIRPEQPDRRPLHAYRCTKDELEALQVRLRAALKQPGVPQGRHVAAAFCLFAAEWWRRNYDGGPWAWRPIFESLGRPYEHATAAHLTETGLHFWRRPLRQHRGSRLFLVSLLLEGGFPLSILEHQHGSLRRYLVRVLEELDRVGGQPSLAAAIAEGASAWLPASLRHGELYQVVGDLLAEIIKIRDRLPDNLGSRDPVALLDETVPGWRNDLPLSIEDAPARQLIYALLKESVDLQNRAQLLSSLCHRTLLFTGGRWQPALGFTVQGAVSAELFTEFAAELQDVVRARLVPSGALSDRLSRPLALIRPSQNRREPWPISPLSGAAEPVVFPLDRAAEVTMAIDGRLAGTLVLPGGQAQLGEVLVFQEAADGTVPGLGTGDAPPPNSPLRLVAAGSARTSWHRMFVLVEPDKVEWSASTSGTVREVASLEAIGRSLVEVRGTVECRTIEDGLPVRLSTSVEDERQARLAVEGRHAPWSIAEAEAFMGGVRPLVIEREGKRGPATAEKLRWRRSGTRAWMPYPSAGLPLGVSEIALVEEGALLDKMRLVVLPRDLQIKVQPADRHSGTIQIRETGGALVSIDHSRLPSDVTVETVESEPGDVDVFLGSAAIPPPSVHVELRWREVRPISIALPFPAQGAGFLGADDTWLPATQQLSVDLLHGVRGRALGAGGAGAYLSGELHAVDVKGKRPFIWRPFQDEISLSSLRPAFERLFAASKDMDAEIRLQIESGGHPARGRLKRFDINLDISEEIVSLANGSSALSRLDCEGNPPVEILARSLMSISDSEETLRALPGDHLRHPGWRVPNPDRLARPILIYGRVDGRYRIRPRIVPALREACVHGGEGGITPLQCIVQIPSTQRRMEALCSHFGQLVEDLGHPDWREVDAAREFLQGNLPLATLDYFEALLQAPGAAICFLLISAADGRIESVLAIEDELPFLWTLLPIKEWKASFARYHAYLRGIIADRAGDAEMARELAQDRLLNILDRVVIAEPVLSGQVAMVREHLQLPASKDSISTASARIPGVRALLHEQLSAIRKECLQRNDISRWPPRFSFRDRLASLPQESDLPDADFRTATLCAPYAAAMIALSNVPASHEEILWIREYREFDPVYFDSTYPRALVLHAADQQEPLLA